MIHIVPQLPPEICGLGDYATVVGARIESLFPDVQCCYVAAGYRKSNSSASHKASRDVRASRDGSLLWRAISELGDGFSANDVAVVLHYSGYGYDANGTPEWLVEWVGNRPASLNGVRLVTFFHELFATGRPWQKAFWFSRKQRSITARVAAASDACLTNREQSARWLEQAAGLKSDSVPHLAICSNVGEPDTLIPWESRLPRAVTFGGAAFKRFALFDRAASVAQVLHDVGIGELVDIGELTPVDLKAFEAQNIEVLQKVRLPAEDVGQILCESRIGLLDYNPAYIDKSGVMAAFIAHGVVCLTPATIYEFCRRGLQERNIASIRLFDVLRAKTTSAASTYASRSTEAHARRLVDLAFSHDFSIVRPTEAVAL